MNKTQIAELKDWLAGREEELKSCRQRIIANDKDLFTLSFAAPDLRRQRRQNSLANPCASCRRLYNQRQKNFDVDYKLQSGELSERAPIVKAFSVPAGYAKPAAVHEGHGRKPFHKTARALVAAAAAGAAVPASTLFTPRPSGAQAGKPGRDNKVGSFAGIQLDPSAYTAGSLSEADLRVMVGLYGNRIQDIYELGAGQRWMLEEARRVRSAFFLQILTKAVIPLDPATFRQRADEVASKWENLRSAFVYRNVSMPYRVVLKERQPEINYFDLSDLDMESFDEKLKKLMEADRIRGFDLERDPLLRISVYKSCDKDTYAIILSQPHINSDGTSLGMLFSDLFIGYALDMNGIDKKIEAQSYQNYANYLETIDTDQELSYWKKKLDGINKDQNLPGWRANDLDYEMSDYFVPFTDEERSWLKSAQKSFKVTQFMLLQGIWGIMAARMKGRNDFVLGSIISGRDEAVMDSMLQGGGFVNVLPVRIQFEEDERFSDFISRTQQDFSESMQHSHCSPGQIENALGRDRSLFGLLLNNHNYARPKASGFGENSISGVHVLGGDSYDNLSSDLCVYFTVVDGVWGCKYSYNGRAFSREMIELYAASYKEALSGLKDLTMESPISALPAPDVTKIRELQKSQDAEFLKIAGFLKRHPVFMFAEDSELIALAKCCGTRTYADEEIIVPKDQHMDVLPILVSGRAIIYGEDSSGWNNPLVTMKRENLLSFAGLFDDMKTKELVVSAAPETIVLNVPVREMLSFCRNHSRAFLALLRLEDDLKNRFMTLWLMAE